MLAASSTVFPTFAITGRLALFAELISNLFADSWMVDCVWKYWACQFTWNTVSWQGCGIVGSLVRKYLISTLSEFLVFEAFIPTHVPLFTTANAACHMMSLDQAFSTFCTLFLMAEKHAVFSAKHHSAIMTLNVSSGSLTGTQLSFKSLLSFQIPFCATESEGTLASYSNC